MEPLSREFPTPAALTGYLKKEFPFSWERGKPVGPPPQIIREVWAVPTCTHIFQALKLPVSQGLLLYPTLNRSRLRAELTSPSFPQ